LRHWKATNMKHKGYDLFDIAAFLGHRNIKNTTIYVHLEKMAYPHGFNDDYLAKVAKTQTEKLQLIEAGFEFVSIDPDGTQYFRKRK
jgi:integrase